MDAFRTPEVLWAVATAAAGVALFGLAPYLPAVFPPWFTRLIGLFVTVLALATVWLLTWSWQAVALLGGVCFLLMVVVHLLQGRRVSRAADSAPIDAASSESSQN